MNRKCESVTKKCFVSQKNDDVSPKNDIVSQIYFFFLIFMAYLSNTLKKMKILFDNATSVDIFPTLQTLGYTEEKINTLKQKVSELETLAQKQLKETAESMAETKKFQTAFKKVQNTYNIHIALCRILFQNDTLAQVALELSGTRKRSYSASVAQMQNFYAQILANEHLATKLATINIKKTDIQKTKTEIEALIALKNSQTKESSEAEQATEARDKAFEEIYAEYQTLSSYAKIVFKGSQVLETLGIKTRRK